jgi:hypothetical protein
MRILTILLLILIIVASWAYISKPSDFDCRQKTESMMITKIESEMPSGGFGSGIVQKVAELSISKGITVTDHLFYKSITFSNSGKSRTLGWAAFGRVHFTK